MPGGAQRLCDSVPLKAIPEHSRGRLLRDLTNWRGGENKENVPPSGSTGGGGAGWTHPLSDVSATPERRPPDTPTRDESLAALMSLALTPGRVDSEASDITCATAVPHLYAANSPLQRVGWQPQSTPQPHPYQHLHAILSAVSRRVDESPHPHSPAELCRSTSNARTPIAGVDGSGQPPSQLVFDDFAAAAAALHLSGTSPQTTPCKPGGTGTRGAGPPTSHPDLQLSLDELLRGCGVSAVTDEDVSGGELTGAGGRGVPPRRSHLALTGLGDESYQSEGSVGDARFLPRGVFAESDEECEEGVRSLRDGPTGAVRGLTFSTTTTHTVDTHAAQPDALAELRAALQRVGVDSVTGAAAASDGVLGEPTFSVHAPPDAAPVWSPTAVETFPSPALHRAGLAGCDGDVCGAGAHPTGGGFTVVSVSDLVAGETLDDRPTHPSAGRVCEDAQAGMRAAPVPATVTKTATTTAHTSAHPTTTGPLAGGAAELGERRTGTRRSPFMNNMKAAAGSLIAIGGRRVPVTKLHLLRAASPGDPGGDDDAVAEPAPSTRRLPSTSIHTTVMKGNTVTARTTTTAVAGTATPASPTPFPGMGAAAMAGGGSARARPSSQQGTPTLPHGAAPARSASRRPSGSPASLTTTPTGSHEGGDSAHGRGGRTAYSGRCRPTPAIALREGPAPSSRRLPTAAVHVTVRPSVVESEAAAGTPATTESDLMVTLRFVQGRTMRFLANSALGSALLAKELAEGLTHSRRAGSPSALPTWTVGAGGGGPIAVRPGGFYLARVFASRSPFDNMGYEDAGVCVGVTKLPASTAEWESGTVDAIVDGVLLRIHDVEQNPDDRAHHQEWLRLRATTFSACAQQFAFLNLPFRLVTTCLTRDLRVCAVYYTIAASEDTSSHPNVSRLVRDLQYRLGAKVVLCRVSAGATEE